MSDKESKTHPTHRQRIEYAMLGKFNNELVKSVCNDNDYDNAEGFYGMYDDIELE